MEFDMQLEMERNIEVYSKARAAIPEILKSCYPTPAPSGLKWSAEEAINDKSNDETCMQNNLLQHMRQKD